MNTRSSQSLRTLLIADAVSCALMGGVLALGAGAVAALTEIPAVVLLVAGLSLFPVAAFMAIAGTRRVIPQSAVGVIVTGNILWVVASVLLLVGPWIAPNLLGTLFVAGQAAFVAVLAGLEYRAGRAEKRNPRVGQGAIA